MKVLIEQIVELHARTAELKATIVGTPDLDKTTLRSGIYQLEAAIYVMERSVADMYRATKKVGEA